MKPFVLLISIVALVGLGVVPVAAQHDKKSERKETLHAKPVRGLPSYRTIGSLSGDIRSVGADMMETLMKLWIDGFTKLYPNVHFTMEAEGSVTAGPALTTGKSDIGPVAREMLPNEAEPFKQKFGYEPFAVRVSGGSYRTAGNSHAIAFLVNKKNPITRLTYAQLDAIFSTTRKLGYKEDITTWGQLGLTGEWADKPIHLWSVKRPNGIAYFVQLRVFAGGEYKDGINERTTVGSLPALDAIAQGVAADPYAIGIAGFGNLTPDVKALALSEKQGGTYFTGTFDEVVDQKYPLSRVTYIYLNRPPGQPLDPKVREFLKYILSKEGQDTVLKEGIFLPLPAEMVKQELAKLK
jgi:phosphate transport system substrate-binding protein